MKCVSPPWSRRHACMVRHFRVIMSHPDTSGFGLRDVNVTSVLVWVTDVFLIILSPLLLSDEKKQLLFFVYRCSYFILSAVDWSFLLFLSLCFFSLPPQQEENVATSPHAKRRQQLRALCLRWRPVKDSMKTLENLQTEASRSQRAHPT